MRLSSIPFGNAFSLFKHFDIIAIDVWGHSLSQTEGTIKFFHWAWANPLKVQQSVSTVQLVAHYLHDQHTTNDMYEDEYDIKDAIVMCNYVLHNKDELKNKKAPAFVWQLKIKVLLLQDSINSDKSCTKAVTKATETVDAAVDCGHEVKSWDVLQDLVRALNEKSLDELAARIHFYLGNKRKYDEFSERKAREEKIQCIVCYDVPIELIFSCGHAVTCQSCYDQMVRKKCVKCNKCITETRRCWIG